MFSLSKIFVKYLQNAETKSKIYLSLWIIEQKGLESLYKKILQLPLNKKIKKYDTLESEFFKFSLRIFPRNRDHIQNILYFTVQ